MKKRLAPLVVVLAIPVLASVVALLARAQWDAQWSSGLRREFVMHGQRANARVMERYSLATLCGDARTAVRIPPCRTYNTFSPVILGSGVTGGVGLLLLGGILAAGAAARRSRRALLTGFRPALYVVTGTLVLLLLVHGLLALQTIRLLTIVGGIGSGALLAFFGLGAVALVVGASLAAARMARAAGDARRLLATRLDGGLTAGWLTGSAQPVVAGLVPEVFVASPGAISVDGPLEAASLHLPLTLARILTVPQLQALVRRAQFRMTDDGGRVARLTEAWAALSAEHGAMRRAGGLRGALGLPILSVLTLLFDAFADAEAALERQQQLAADRAAADAGDAHACGVAILKVAAFAPAWAAAVREMKEAVRAGSQYPNACLLFEEIVATNADAARVAAAVHPAAVTPPVAVPLRQRLERLGLVPEELIPNVLDVHPAEPASAVRTDLTAFEERLTAIVHLQLLLHTSRL
ncbi:MAG: hypothetical protein EHM24_07780 [Acidobacteria bacterium]|nr:MAG: hypothetical protein EHM24_16200 [Acidobacteriota bacterium]RPJ73528.1 MAG: hypothetical protein EHM24_07780 [Acidobacteriota bacterium]